MRRGTTKPLSFTLPFSANQIKVAYVTLRQMDEGVMIEKTFDDCTMTQNVIRCFLTQKDTLKLKPNRDVYVQLRAKTFSDEAFASDVYTEFVEDVLKDGEI